jgi:hypothetical protein
MQSKIQIPYQNIFKPEIEFLTDCKLKFIFTYIFLIFILENLDKNIVKITYPRNDIFYEGEYEMIESSIIKNGNGTLKKKSQHVIY